MAAQNLYGLPLANIAAFPPGTVTTQKCDGVSFNGCGAVFLCECGIHGAIKAIAVKTTAITSPPTFRASLQSVASRLPTGTILGSTTAYADFTPAVGFSEIALGTPYTGTTGDLIAVCLSYQTGTIGASNNATFNYAVANGGAVGQAPFPVSQNNSGTWSVNTSQSPMICPIYNDGYYGRGFWAANTIASTSFINTSNPKYYGSKWTPQIGGVFSGAWAGVRPATGSSFMVTLYDGTTAQSTSVTVDPNTALPANSYGNYFVPMPSFTLVSGTAYRLVISMTTGTAFTTFYGSSFWTAPGINSAWGPLYGTTGSSGSLTWTDYDGTTTNDFRAYPVVPQIDSLTASGGSNIFVIEEE